MIRRKKHSIPQWQVFGPPEEQPNLFGGGGTFLTLYPLLRTPWFAIIVRKITGVDGADVMHTHGMVYATIILRGGYVEQRRGGMRVRKLGHVQVFRREDVHAIRRLLRNPTWTLGLHCKWLGFTTPEMVLADGRSMSIWDYAKLPR